MEVFTDAITQNVVKQTVFLNTSNGANISVLKVQAQSNRNNAMHIYGFIYHDHPCFLTCKLMTWMDTTLDQLLDVTISCLSIQLQNLSILPMEHFPNTISIDFTCQVFLSMI